MVWNQNWWDHSEREAARLHPLLDRIFNGDHREAILTSPVCAGNLCHVGETPLPERIIGNLLFLNSAPDPTSWDNRDIRRMAEEISQFQPAIIEADPAYLALLSRSCLGSDVALYQPECIILTYEYPSRLHYRQIQQAFPGVPVISSYGSTETGYLFTQCETGNFHQNTATCYIDIQPFRPQLGDSQAGRMLVTTLDNPWFVLLRFEVGDLARLHDGAGCPCGNTRGIVLECIEGRFRDITFDTANQVVTLKKLDDALEVADGLTGYQLEQSGPGEYILRYSAEPGNEQVTERVLADVLHTVYGTGARIEIHLDSALPPEQSGKFRLAYSKWEHPFKELFVDR